MIFDLTPNQGPTPLALGMTAKQAEAILGLGMRAASRRAGEEAFRFADASVRLVFRKDRVVEISISPPSAVVFDGADLFESEDGWMQLVALEPHPAQTLGFVVLKSLGIAFTGLHDGDVSQLSISMFEPGRWDELDASMTPFNS